MRNCRYTSKGKGRSKKSTLTSPTLPIHNGNVQSAALTGFLDSVKKLVSSLPSDRKPLLVAPRKVKQITVEQPMVNTAQTEIDRNPLHDFSEWVLTGNVYCPTGKGGGVDPTCSPNEPKSNRFSTLKEATNWAKANGAKVVTTDVKSASEQIADEVMVWVEHKKKQGTLPSDPPPREEIVNNWQKTFRSKKVNEGDLPAFKDLDNDLHLEIQNSINDNHTNQAYRKYVDVNGDVPVIYRRQEKGNSAAAEWRGGVHIYSNSFWKGEGTDPYEPGGATAGGSGGYAAVLRHEFGHKLYGKLTREQENEWRSLVPPTVDKDLTSYAGKNKEEAFCEVFAITTDKRYKPEIFPAWVEEARKKQEEWLTQ